MIVTIVDYGVGNLGSIKNMLKKIGINSVVESDPNNIERAKKIILPGVGAFDAGMEQLNNSGLRAALDYAVLQCNVPVMGICLGMQLMTECSEEGTSNGLGWVPARTVRFDFSGAAVKVPHMGWNSVSLAKSSKILNSLEQEPRFYFVHSYHVLCRDNSDILLNARYGDIEFVAGFQRKNILGFQFHPEKSHRFGMTLMTNFISL